MKGLVFKDEKPCRAELPYCLRWRMEGIKDAVLWLLDDLLANLLGEPQNCLLFGVEESQPLLAVA